MTWGASPAEWAHFDLILGLTADLLPVVSNPGAAISANSKLKGLGKTPSRYDRSREVVGIGKWTEQQSTGRQVDAWSKEPDYGICIQTRSVRALDVDVPDVRSAEAISARFLNLVDMALPLRSRGSTGKRLFAFTLPGEFAKRSFKVEGGLVEFLATGQQFIAVGTHPSGTRYEWAGGLPDEFPVVSAEAFERAWAAIVGEFAIEAPRETQTRGALGDDLDVEDPVASWLVENYETYGAQGGKLFVACPWKDGHSSDSGETEAAWLVAGSRGYEQGHFECLHASCAGRRDDEFLDAVGYRVSAFEALPALVDEHGREIGARPNFKRSSPKKGYDATPSNVRMAIERCDYTELCIRYDTFRGEIMIADYPAKLNWRPFKDADYFELRVRLERLGFQPIGHELIRQAVHWIADLQQFDTAQLWLEEVVPEWDGVPRVDRFFVDYFGAADTPYARAVGAYAWTAQAGRILKPGCKADMIPVLVGEQGARKSSGVAAISPSDDYFVEIGLHEKDDDMSRKMRGALVAEIAELRGLNSRDAESIKAWVAKRHEKWVPKFLENATTMPRRLLFYGTSNQHELLADETGERRWLPLRVGRVDVAAIERDRLQLWAEGAARWRAGGIEWAAAEALGRAEHRAFKVSDVWEERIAAWLDQPDIGGMTPRASGKVRIVEVLEQALGLDIRSVKKPDEMRVARILGNLDMEKADKWIDGKTRKVWVDISSPPLTTSGKGGKGQKSQ